MPSCRFEYCTLLAHVQSERSGPLLHRDRSQSCMKYSVRCNKTFSARKALTLCRRRQGSFPRAPQDPPGTDPSEPERPRFARGRKAPNCRLQSPRCTVAAAVTAQKRYIVNINGCGSKETHTSQESARRNSYHISGSRPQFALPKLFSHAHLPL